MKVYTGIILAVVYIGYIFLGGVAFHYLERSNEKQDTKKIRDLRQVWLENNTCITDAELGDLLERVITAYENGVVTKRGEPNEDGEESWSFHKSVYFATTVVSTIGYGNIAPATTWGRIICVLFAIFGIPLALVVYGYVGSHLDSLLSRIVGRCFKDPKSKKAKLTRSVVNVIGGVTIFILLPAIAFVRYEDWEYGEACYYGFITLTTVGLGDFVAGFDDEQRQGYHFLVSLWICIGLAWMSSLVSNMYDLFNTKFDAAFGSDENINDEDAKTSANGVKKDTGQNEDIVNGGKNGYIGQNFSNNIDDSCTVGVTNNSVEENINSVRL